MPRKKISPQVGKKIQIIRKQLNMTQVEFSRALSVSQPTLSRMESGYTRPRPEIAKTLKRVSGRSLDWILG